MRTFIVHSVLFLALPIIISGGQPLSAEQSILRLQSVVTWIPFWEQDQSFRSFVHYHNRFTHLDLFWYRLDPNGIATTYQHTSEDVTILQFTRERRIQVFALVSNMKDAAVEDAPGWDARRVENAIGTPASRSRHVQSLLRLVDRHQFDGLTIDYEELEPVQKGSFTAFIKLLGAHLQAKGKKLSVVVYPKRSADSPETARWYRSQDIRALGRYADRLVVMSFGEHWQGGPPGPKSSEWWLSEVCAYLVTGAGVNVGKICLEFEADGIDTDTLTSEAIGIRHEDVYKLRLRYGARVQRQPGGTTPFFTYLDPKGHQHVVWYEDAWSIRAKIALANSYGISNFGYWNIGKETPALMQAFPVLNK